MLGRKVFVEAILLDWLPKTVLFVHPHSDSNSPVSNLKFDRVKRKGTLQDHI